MRVVPAARARAKLTLPLNSGRRSAVRSGVPGRIPPLVRVVFAAFLFVFATPPRAGIEAPSPGQSGAVKAARFVEAFSTRAVAVLQDDRLTEAERDEAFRRMLLDGFDTFGGARFALSQGWRRADERQRAEYVRLFREEILRMGKRFFEDYQGETLTVQRTRPFGYDKFLVETKLSNLDAMIDDIDFLVRKEDGEFRIVDMYFEGQSVLQAYRSEFVGRMFRAGVPGVLRMLRRSVDR